MKRSLLLPLLILVLAGNAQKNKRININTDSFTIKIQGIKDSIEKTKNDIQWENNMRNLEDVMKTVEKNKKREKTKGIIYIVIGVGLLLVLIIGLLRRRGEKRA